jgi:acetyl esterase/lipase
MRSLSFTAALAALSATAAWVADPALAASGARVDRNVVYGMVSGTALLLDVHRPATPNGYGIVFIAGSGFQASSDYGAKPIKDTQIDLWGPPLTDAGYTVFSVNHRGAPGFHYPAAIDDVTRAIRFIRSRARDYGIDARLGGLGGSSGGNLIALAALRASPGAESDADPVDREPATLEAIVLRAPAIDLRNPPVPRIMGFVVAYMGMPPGESPQAKALYDAASPITLVGPHAPPTLLIHGDADELIPYADSVAMQTALLAAKVEAKLVTVPGGRHGADFGVAGPALAGWPNYHAETVRWFDRHLRRR